jgi:hypothetical protein
MKRISLLFVLVLALSALASANIIPTLVSGSPTGSGPFLWSYSFTLSGDQNALVGSAPSGPATVLNSATGVGAFVTIYDFAGYVNGTCTGPTGWTCSVQNVGFTPELVTPTDNASLVNLTFTLTTGSNILGGGSPTTGVPLGTTFAAQSTYSVPTMGWYTGRAVKNIGEFAGSIGSNIGNVAVPNVPEPATMGLIGAGLVGLGLLRRRARKS